MYSKIALSACHRVSLDCRLINSALLDLKNVSTAGLERFLLILNRWGIPTGAIL